MLQIKKLSYSTTGEISLFQDLPLQSYRCEVNWGSKRCAIK